MAMRLIESEKSHRYGIFKNLFRNYTRLSLLIDLAFAEYLSDIK
jgi:hypothetical protein